MKKDIKYIMKKLLFGLGSLSLAVIPIAVLASCSSSTNTEPTVNTEADKFKTTRTKATTLTATVASNTITNAEDPATKKAALQTLIDFPKLDDDFDFSVENSWPKSSDDKAIVVTVSVFAKSDTTTKIEKNFEVNGFADATELEKAALKFSVPVDTNILITSSLSTLWINEAVGPEAKKEALESLVKITDIPTTPGFTFEVKSACFNSENKYQIEVSITITQISSLQEQDVIFFVKNLKSESDEKIELEKQMSFLPNKDSINENILSAAEVFDNEIIRNNETLDNFYAR
ncbi:MAG: hypothetical protein ACRC63_02120, partial [Metamycoplasmataceae bacterium]